MCDPWGRTGHPRLMAAIRKLRMRTGKAKDAKELVLECQVSAFRCYDQHLLTLSFLFGRDLV